jgi:hypothetical protein
LEGVDAVLGAALKFSGIAIDFVYSGSTLEDDHELITRNEND